MVMMLLLLLLLLRGWSIGVLRKDVAGSDKLISDTIYRMGSEAFWRWRSGCFGIISGSRVRLRVLHNVWMCHSNGCLRKDGRMQPASADAPQVGFGTLIVRYRFRRNPGG